MLFVCGSESKSQRLVHVSNQVKGGVKFEGVLNCGACVWTVGMVNCWEEAVAMGLQLAVFHALEAANDPDGGAESVPPSLTVPNWRCRPLGSRVLGHDRAEK